MPQKLVDEVVQDCQICARFKKVHPRGPWHQPPYSLVPGHTVYMDLIRPLERGRFGMKYIQCIVDTATRFGGAWRWRTSTGRNVVKGLNEWVKYKGPIKRIVTDNAPYIISEEMKEWCEENHVTHIPIAPHRHQSIGLVERYQQTLIDRLRRITLD